MKLRVFHIDFNSVALKPAAILRALESAAGCPTPSPDDLAALRDRTAAFYGLEMTPTTAARAAAIVWNPLLDFFFQRTANNE